MFLQAWFLSNTPQIRGGMGGKSTALFEENLSLICCSCRGPFGQLNRAGFGSFPNEGTTCYTWIGHLRGTQGHRGIWLSFPLWPAWGKQGGEKKNVHFIYLMSCSAASKGPTASSQIRRGSHDVMKSRIWEWELCDWFAQLWGVISLFLFLCCNSINVKVLLLSRRYGRFVLL